MTAVENTLNNLDLSGIDTNTLALASLASRMDLDSDKIEDLSQVVAGLDSDLLAVVDSDDIDAAIALAVNALRRPCRTADADSAARAIIIGDLNALDSDVGAVQVDVQSLLASIAALQLANVAADSDLAALAASMDSDFIAQATLLANLNSLLTLSDSDLQSLQTQVSQLDSDFQGNVASEHACDQRKLQTQITETDSDLTALAQEVTALEVQVATDITSATSTLENTLTTQINLTDSSVNANSSLSLHYRHN